MFEPDGGDEIIVDDDVMDELEEIIRSMRPKRCNTCVFLTSYCWACGSNSDCINTKFGGRCYEVVQWTHAAPAAWDWRVDGGIGDCPSWQGNEEENDG